MPIFTEAFATLAGTWPSCPSWIVIVASGSAMGLPHHGAVGCLLDGGVELRLCGFRAVRPVTESPGSREPPELGVERGAKRDLARAGECLWDALWEHALAFGP